MLGYFDPHSAEGLAGTLHKVLWAVGATGAREILRTRGQLVASRYLPGAILPRWEQRLKRLPARTTT